jgi:tetraacyldisaccharide 4'-kinase
MDDAYQHRAAEAGLNMLLFDYNRLDEPHLLLPAGNLREPFSGRWRAQVIIVTKCPPALNSDGQAAAISKIKPLPYQHLFFTNVAYQPLHNLQGNAAGVVIDNDTTVFLLTGIANARPLLAYLSGFTPHVIHHNYPDHHQFTLKNIAKLAAEYGECEAQKKIIITTEKDAERLQRVGHLLPVAIQPDVFVVPIKVEFLNDGGLGFNRLITDYVREHTTYNELH